MYLDHPSVISLAHCRQICSGDRKTIKCKDVRHVHVPQFDSLSIAHMLEFAKGYPEVFEILPSEEREIAILHRQYVANVIFYVAGQEFTKWINQRLHDRVEKLREDRNLNIKMDPEIYDIFQKSQSISGKSIIFNSFIY